MSHNKYKFGRVGVLMGGCSSEREISLQSGQAVYDALHGMGLDVQAIDLRDDQPDRVHDLLLEKKVEGVFIALHGRFGEDGQIQKLCEQLGLPYTGSDAVASRRAYNKIITQSTLLAHNVMVPDFVTMESQDPDRIPATVASLGSYPFVVKPACEGSSIGVTVVRDETELRRAVEEAWGYGPYVLIERFVPGRELTVGILGDVPLDAVEVVTQRAFYDFTAKYQEGQTEYKVPADLPLEIRHVLQETAFKVHTVMGCRDISRVDFRLDQDLKPFVLEINTIPGFTPYSLLPKAAAHAQISFDKLCLTLLNLAYAQKKEKNLLPLIIKSLLILLIIAAAGGIGLLCYVEGGELIRTSRRFTVKKIVIDPTLRFIQHRDLQVIQGQSIFDVDLQDMESRLMLKYPEISELRVERKFPDEIHLVAKKRMQLAQVPFRQSFLVVDDEGVVLAKKEKRDKELPAIEGFKIPRGPVELGSRIRHQRLRTALEIITSFNENAALSSYRIDNLDIDQSSKIMVYLDRDIKAILDDQRVDRKINVLGFVLTQGNLDLREVNYIDLRFKDPIIGKK